MATVTKTPKQRKLRKLEPVSGKCRWVGGVPSLAALDAGNAMLLITPEGKEPAPYHVQRLLDGERVAGFRLTKAGIEEAVYDVDGETGECSCPDATYNDARPGGCKHAKAVRAAVAVVSK
jgi:hypothetical protein